jgi:hypothetical protein
MNEPSDPRLRRKEVSKKEIPLRSSASPPEWNGEERVIMNKSTLLGLALAMLVSTVALADGVSIDGDLRLRWEYGSIGDASFNNNDAVINFGVAGNVSDNVSVTASLRHFFAFDMDGGTGGVLNIQEVYATIVDLGAANGMLAGWSLDVGRMNLPDYDRVIHADDWFSGAAPTNTDGYHASSAMGGIDIDIYHHGGGGVPAGNSDSATGFHFGFGDMSGMADLALLYWSFNPAGGGDTGSITSIYANDIGGDALAGIDLDFQYGTSDDGGAGDNGTLTVISFGYQMEGVGLHASNSVADENWVNALGGVEKHGTYGITDLFIAANDIEATTIGANFQPMEGIDATVNFITLGVDSTGADLGTEIDVILGWDCGDDVRMDIGYGSFSPDGAGDDVDYVYLQTGWDF